MLFLFLVVRSESQRNLSVCLELFTNYRFHNWSFWDPKLQPQISGLFDMKKMLAITRLPAWIPPDLSLSVSPLILLTFSLKVKNAWEICVELEEKTERNSVSVNLSCRRGTGSQRSVTLHFSGPETGETKSPPLLPASPLLGLYASDQISLTTSVSEPARFHSSPAQYFTSVQTKKKKTETSARGQTNQFERADKCNKPKVYFSTPTKWVLRYCITLFI